MDKLADPAVQGDSKEFQKVSKAMGALQDVVHKYQKYKECLQGSEEAKAMAKEAAGDDEMVAMAKEEADSLMQEAEKDLKVKLLNQETVGLKKYYVRNARGDRWRRGGYLRWRFAQDVY